MPREPVDRADGDAPEVAGFGISVLEADESVSLIHDMYLPTLPDERFANQCGNTIPREVLKRLPVIIQKRVTKHEQSNLPCFRKTKIWRPATPYRMVCRNLRESGHMDDMCHHVHGRWLLIVHICAKCEPIDFLQLLILSI